MGKDKRNDPVLAIFIRTDLNMSRGKIAVQAGHAVAMVVYTQSKWEINRAPEYKVSSVKDWMENDQVKIVLAVNSMEDLDEIAQIAKRNLVPYLHVFDIGRTEVEPNTVTCLAVGIESRRRIGKITAGWKTLK